MNNYSSSRRLKLSQNFIKNPSLVRHMLSFLEIPEKSLVLDLGAGKGIITEALCVEGYNVWSVEKDLELILNLKDAYKNNFLVTILDQDILKVNLPTEGKFWVVSNPPFSIFSQIIKKLIFGPNCPEGMLIVGQKEAVQRLIGQEESSITSIIFQSFYNIDIPYLFQDKDFSPKPSVSVCLLRARKISNSLWKDKENYEQFIKYVYMQQKQTAFKNMEHIFTYIQWKRISKQLQITIDCRVQELSITQWKSLYQVAQNYVSKDKLIKIGLKIQ